MRGVAAFASAPWGRVLLVQLIVALIAAGTVVWFLHRAWFPKISEAIRQLPAQGEIQSGRLDWPEGSPARLADGRFIALAVDLDHTGAARSPAHLQVEFGRGDCKVFSLAGYVSAKYPRGQVIPFNRTDLVPWWGAWAPAILAVAATLVVVGLLVSWACLATVYTLPAWLVGFFANREVSLDGSWRLAGAALMPGALIMCAGTFLYGWGALDPVQLAVVATLHLVIGWVYVALSPLYLPRPAEATTKANPFA